LSNLHRSEAATKPNIALEESDTPLLLVEFKKKEKTQSSASMYASSGQGKLQLNIFHADLRQIGHI